ncbi:MAG: fliE [Alphaproteobacteria bacterium]|nr:fliE [Alphaproteobacteria bacterium]
MTAINPGAALGAYKAASQIGAGMGGGVVDQVAENTSGAKFGEMLKTATQNTIDSQKSSEKVSADAVLGKADLTDVVNSVNNAEMTLTLFLAVRDKMMDAYNQISRTQI